MSVTIITRMADGSQRLQHFQLEQTGEQVLESILDAQRASGHTIARDGDLYTMTDRKGELVQRVVVSRA